MNLRSTLFLIGLFALIRLIFLGAMGPLIGTPGWWEVMMFRTMETFDVLTGLGMFVIVCFGIRSDGRSVTRLALFAFLFTGLYLLQEVRESVENTAIDFFRQYLPRPV